MDQILKDTIPPHSLEAEKATLGALFLDWGAISKVVVIVAPDHFYSQQNQIIYKEMVSMFNQSITCDTLTMITSLTKAGLLEKAGGAAYIASLTDVVPTAANVEYYAHIVLDNATRRNLIKMSEQIKASAFDETRDVRSILEDAEKKIFSITDLDRTIPIYSMGEVVPHTLDIIEKHVKNHAGYTGIPSGFSELDQMTSGFQDSEMIIIGARPSIGKTAFALSMMQNIAIEKGIPTGFFSLEMANDQIGQRLLSQEARVSGKKLRSGYLQIAELQKLQDAAGRMFEAPLYIVDIPNMQLVDLRAMARRMVSNYGVKIIFIDYIGLISTGDSKKEQWEQISDISKSLKGLARELQIPVVVLCQVARDAEGSEPSLNQLRGSGSIEQDADVVMFLHRERKKQEDGQQDPVQDAKLIVAKQRNGPIGDVEILFLANFTRFENKMREN